MAPAEGKPELDPEVLRELEAAIGPEAIAELVALVGVEVAARLAEFGRAVEGHDMALARRAAHTLKSACTNVGAMDYARFCGNAEAAALGNDEAAVAGAQAELQRRAAQVLKELLAARNLSKR